MNQFNVVLRENSAKPVRIAVKGGSPQSASQFPLLPGKGPPELREARVGATACNLAEYIREKTGPETGAGLLKSLERLLGSLNAYRFRGYVPAKGVPLTLDAAEQQAKWFLFTKYGNARVRLGLSSNDYDYRVSEMLLKAADALSYYLEPNGDKIVVRFLLGHNLESQIKLEGYKISPMPEEVKDAISALLGLVGAEIVPNGNSYVISVA